MRTGSSLTEATGETTGLLLLGREGVSGTMSWRQGFCAALSDRPDSELLTNLSGKAVIDLSVTGHRNLGASCGIQDDGVTAAFPEKRASLPVEVVQQFVAFHLRAVPAWIDRGMSSIRSASSL